MTKELEVLIQLKEFVSKYPRNNLVRSFISDRFDIIEKALKALEIIKEVIPIEEQDFFYDKETDTYFFVGNKVSKEQFDLLKEVLL